MISLVVAVVACGLAVTWLVPGPNRAALRHVRPPGAGDIWPASRIDRNADRWSAAFGVMRQVSSLQWRFGMLAGALCWLLMGQSVGAVMAGCAVVAAAIALLRWLEGAEERRKIQVQATQLSACLELFAAALDAGLPLRAAVRHLAALVPEPSAELLRGVLGHLDLGRSDSQAWLELREHPVWGQVARDLARCASSGAGVAETLAVHAQEARATARARREMAAHTVGVRSVLPLSCCFLPAFILVGVVPIIAGTIGSFALLG